MKARLGTPSDVGAVLELQKENLVTNLTAREMENGFVTTPFTPEQLDDLIGRDGMFVLDDGGVVVGYAMAAGWDYFKGRPMFDYMIERFVGLSYEGTTITYDTSFQYGPVCIAGGRRGTGAFPVLFEGMRARMSSRFDVGTTFINKVNRRSFEAHTRKTGLDVIDEFEFNGNSYYGLGFLTPKS